MVLGRKEYVVPTMWVVYCNPKDYPELYVARKFVDGSVTSELISAGSLEAIRNKIPQGLTCLPRCAQDDPVIVEIWIEQLARRSP